MCLLQILIIRSTCKHSCAVPSSKSFAFFADGQSPFANHASIHAQCPAQKASLFSLTGSRRLPIMQAFSRSAQLKSFAFFADGQSPFDNHASIHLQCPAQKASLFSLTGSRPISRKVRAICLVQAQASALAFRLALLVAKHIISYHFQYSNFFIKRVYFMTLIC